MPLILPGRPPRLKPLRGTQLDRTHPLARGLLLAAALNEGAGKTTTDYSGTCPPSVLTGSMTWVGTTRGMAAAWGTSNNYSTYTLPAAIGTNAYTINALVNITDTATNQAILSLPNASNNLLQINAGVVQFNSGGGTPSIALPGTGVFLVTTAFNNATAQNHMYLNGVIGAGAGVAPNSLGPAVNLGELPTFSVPFKGSILLVLVHNRELSAAEILLLQKDPFGLFLAPVLRRSTTGILLFSQGSTELPAPRDIPTSVATSTPTDTRALLDPATIASAAQVIDPFNAGITGADTRQLTDTQSQVLTSTLAEGGVPAELVLQVIAAGGTEAPALADTFGSQVQMGNTEALAILEQLTTGILFLRTVLEVVAVAESIGQVIATSAADSGTPTTNPSTATTASLTDPGAPGDSLSTLATPRPADGLPTIDSTSQVIGTGRTEPVLPGEQPFTAIGIPPVLDTASPTDSTATVATPAGLEQAGLVEGTTTTTTLGPAAEVLGERGGASTLASPAASERATGADALTTIGTATGLEQPAIAEIPTTLVVNTAVVDKGSLADLLRTLAAPSPVDLLGSREVQQTITVTRIGEQGQPTDYAQVLFTVADRGLVLGTMTFTVYQGRWLDSFPAPMLPYIPCLGGARTMLTNVPPVVDITLVRGSTIRPALVINQVTQNPICGGADIIVPADLSGATRVLLVVKSNVFTDDPTAILAKDNQGLGGIVVISAPQGKLQITFAASDVSSYSLFPEAVAQPYAIKAFFPNGDEQDVLTGTFTVVTLAARTP